MPRPILGTLPQSLRRMIESLPEPMKHSLEEIRVRQGRPLEVITRSQSRFVSARGQPVQKENEGYHPTKDDCAKMLNLVSNHSLYALEEELRRGYVTIEGGHRIGLTGRVVVEGGEVKHLREVTGFNLRIARPITGVALPLLPRIRRRNRLDQLLVVSPPQCGKTTLIRDLARLASLGEGGLIPQKVGIVDERSEIAGCVDGVPQLGVGPRTDVLDGCPKAEGMMMMIRSMSPDLLVVDEIGRKEDTEAIFEAVHAGVHLITTAHGRSMDEICRRPALSRLIRERVFSRYVLLSRKQGPGTVEAVFDGSLKRLTRREVAETL
ncbi:stage III sporulation protein AA [Paludifilum halophilum]|uniref:Stage III sporulation protein AA n=1 Tax=Paludifilum halophilum TaxID=1642702 RepID=A0A235BC26_9BACL|nr:stage III sporulation protein AA [Paludifilum halophilum]OYD09840.1 stage III sporulation protein AA [Paludifilum halophilum]